MISYVLRRVAATVPVLGFVGLFVFFLLRLTPGDPAILIAGDQATTAQIASIRTQLGLDLPLTDQLLAWRASSRRAISAVPSSPTWR
ncbi:hypothetical protein BTHI11S_01453 [Bosea thiooxidans]